MKVERMDVFRYYKKDRNYAFEGHRHEGYEVNILLQGEMKVTCDRQMFHLHAGELLCFSADSFHRNRVLCDNTIFISFPSSNNIISSSSSSPTSESSICTSNSNPPLSSSRSNSEPSSNKM